MNKLRSFLTSLEDSNIGFGLWVCTVLSIIFIRDFLENVASFRAISEIDSFQFVHCPIFFIAILLSVIILLHLFSKTEIIKVSRISSLFLALIILPVATDFLLSSIGRQEMSYYYITKNVALNFAKFLNPFFRIPGIPYGLRIEIFAISTLSFIYIFIKRQRLFLSFIGAFFIFSACFSYISIPGLLVAATKILFPTLKFSEATLSQMFTEGELAQRHVNIIMLLFISLLAIVWFLRYDINKFKALRKNLRFSRTLHYIILVILGIASHFSFNLYLYGLPDNFSLIRLAAVLVAIFFAFQFSVIINDIYDLDCDKISNPDRPLVTGALSRSEYLQVAMVYLALALFFAFNVGDETFMLVLMFIAVYFIYSAPPFRLKRFFPVSSIIIAVQAIIAFLLGYLFLEKTPVTIALPPEILGCLFFVFLLGSSVKDLKDIPGDRASGVYTLPVILGDTKARKIVGLLVGISYLSVPIFLFGIFNFIFLFLVSVLSIAFGFFNYFYILRKDAKEKVIFSAYLTFAIFILFFLTIRNILFVLRFKPK